MFPPRLKMGYSRPGIRYHRAETTETQVADQGLVRETACAIVDKLKAGEVTPLDLLDVLEKRIAEVDDKVNALPILCFDRARKHARALMEKPATERGRLAGLPVPIKDLTNVGGVLTTQGSPIFKDNVPAKSDILVEHLEANGGVIYAKSNTPEFGAGANTFNEVFGPTLNPWDISRSAAGSSGGAAVALATGMAWLAHGTDMGGSLRNPASFCGIVGLRPSIGRVAHTPVCHDRPQSHRPWPDGAQCRGSRPAAGRHERRACGRSAVAALAAGIIPVRGALGQEAEADRLLARSRHHPGRSGSRCHHAGKPLNASPKPAPSSRKPIPICAKPMNASTCFVRSILP